MVILVVGGVIVVFWCFTYFIVQIINAIFGLNISEEAVQNIALYIIDAILIGCGIYCGIYGVFIAIFLCVALHNSIGTVGSSTKYKGEVQKKKNEEKYGVIEWKDI